LVDQELLNNTNVSAMQQDRYTEWINYLDLAMIPKEGKTAVVDFTVAIFRALDYVHRERLARTRVDLPLLICGENRHAKTSVCLVDQNNILLLVQVDKRLEHREPINAQAQLVAEAVAAFNKNNAQREAIGHLLLTERVSHFVSL
jgi:hypothetical protein